MVGSASFFKRNKSLPLPKTNAMATGNTFLASDCYWITTTWDANAKIFPTYEEFINEVAGNNSPKTDKNAYLCHNSNNKERQ